MQEASFSTQDVMEISAATVAELEQRARAAPRGRYRLCLHWSHDDQIQEMLIACVRGTYFRPHRNQAPKSKSYHVVSGELAIFHFDEQGRVTRRIELGAIGSGRPFHLRFPASVWHMPVARSEVSVYIEVCPGPFREGCDPEFAAWSPAKGEEAATRYLEQLLATSDQR